MMPPQVRQRFSQIRIKRLWIVLMVLFLCSVYKLHEMALMEDRANSPSFTLRDEQFLLPSTPTTPVVSLDLSTVLWSRNWHAFADCPHVPAEYYSLENVQEWKPKCTSQYTTECIYPLEKLQAEFVTCNQTIWIRSQSHQGTGDLVNFIHHTLPHLRQPFDLITTDGDNSHPRDVHGAASLLLNNPYLRTWYTQNYDGTAATNNDQKIRPIPIGLDLHTTAHFGRAWNSSAVFDAMQRLREASLAASHRRSSKFHIPPMSTYGTRAEASSVSRRCLMGNLDVTWGRKPPMELFRGYTRHRFGLSPPGNGIDCHRTWEMLFFGMIPVVESGSLDPLFAQFDLPVIAVKNWTELCNIGFLDEQYQRVRHLLPLPDHKLTMAYYLRQS